MEIYGESGNDDIGIVGGVAYGGSGDDFMDATFGSVYGESGNDDVGGDYGTVDGGDGNDQVQGNDGTLIGGLGRDTIAGDIRYSIRYNSPLEGGDTIVGFDPGYDSGGEGYFAISASGFGGGLEGGNDLSSNQFVLGSSAQDRNDRFIYSNGTGNLFFDVDGSGTSGQVQLATLTGDVDLSASDFRVFA